MCSALEDAELVYRGADISGHDQALLVVVSGELEHVLNVAGVHLGHAVRGHDGFNGAHHIVEAGVHSRVAAAAAGEDTEAQREREHQCYMFFHNLTFPKGGLMKMKPPAFVCFNY